MNTRPATASAKLSAKFHAAAILLLVMMGLLAGGAARRESVTIDEIAHIGAGVSYLQELDMRMNVEHPPLAKVLAAVPLVIRGARVDYTHISWTFSGKGFNQFLGEWIFGHWFLMSWNEPHSMLFWARVPMLLLTLALGWTLYIFGSRLGDAWGGLLCLCAFVTMPAFLAFGPLVITDIAVTTFWVLTIWRLPDMWRTPGRGTVFKFGAVLAGAVLSKFSAGLLFLVFVAFALSLRVWPLLDQPTEKSELRAWRRRAWLNLCKGTLWAALLVYLVYLVLSWNQPTDSFQVIPQFPASAVLRRLLMPLWLYLQGLIGFVVSAASRPTYILGHPYPQGVWFYFPTLFFLKSQFAFLLLITIAGIAALRSRFRREGRSSAVPAGMQMHWRSVWISLTVFVAVCLVSRLNISIRHFSIALALITLLLAPMPRMLEALRSSNPSFALAGKWLAIVLAAMSIVTAVRVYPHYFPYLNALGMGRPGYELVNDSNLDWNQGLPEVEKFVERRGIGHVLLDEYGFSDPAAEIPQAELWYCQQPAAEDGGQWAVISANNIRDGSNCGWLLQYPHEALAGGSMYAVRLPDRIPAPGQPGGPPLQRDYRYFGGLPGLDLRRTLLKCIRDPQQLPATMEAMMAMGQNQSKQK